MERTVDEHIARLVRLLEAHYLSTPQQYRPVDFARKIQYFTLDVISDLAFGHPFGFMEQDADVYDFIKITRDFFPVAVLTGNIPSLVSLLHSPLFRGLLPKASDKLGFGAFIGYAVICLHAHTSADTSLESQTERSQSASSRMPSRNPTCWGPLSATV